jgi:ketosteroid isomerase-like protein
MTLGCASRCEPVTRDSHDDEEEIRGLICAYAERIDAGDLDGVADLFTHGAFRSARTGAVLVGRDAVREQYRSVVIFEDGTPRTRHVLGNIRIELGTGGDEAATARCTFTVLQSPPEGGVRAVLAGRYQDEFERVDGVWHFRERTVYPDLIGDLSGHMQRGRD